MLFSRRLVQLAQLLIVLILVLGFLLGLVEELVCDGGEELLEGSVTYFAHDEVLVIGLCGLAVQNEGVLAFLREIGIVPVQRPITGFDGLLGFFLALAHVDTMVDAGCVGDYEGGPL